MHIQRTYLLYHFFSAQNPYNINLYLSMNNIQVLDLEGNALTEPQEWPMVESCAKTSQEVRKKKIPWKVKIGNCEDDFLFFFGIFFLWLLVLGRGMPRLIPGYPGYLDIWLEKKHDGTLFFFRRPHRDVGSFFCCRNDEKRQKIRSKKLWNLRITSYQVFPKKNQKLDLPCFFQKAVPYLERLNQVTTGNHHWTPPAKQQAKQTLSLNQPISLRLNLSRMVLCFSCKMDPYQLWMVL